MPEIYKASVKEICSGKPVMIVGKIVSKKLFKPAFFTLGIFDFGYCLIHNILFFLNLNKKNLVCLGFPIGL